MLGWFQEGDPDRVLAGELFLQIRMCAPEIVGETPPPSAIRLSIIIAIFVAGRFLSWKTDCHKPK
ncbi:MAG: hypothetical protein FIA97_15970 [Methylococcaceae bacterium]|nr:hypothetical protein [Methylococcaceae bacterium]